MSSRAFTAQLIVGWNDEQLDTLIRIVIDFKYIQKIKASNAFWNHILAFYNKLYPDVVRSTDDLIDQYTWFKSNKNRIKQALLGYPLLLEAWKQSEGISN